ncbi:MAG: hypothetical protein ACOYL6_08840 [Bacteriovoracaceae bacterium]
MKKIFICTLLFASFTSMACLHYSQSYEGQVTENKKEFFLFANKEGFHLVTKTNLSSEKELPERLDWIFPLPALPKRYEEVDPGLFKELHELTTPVAKGGRGGALDQNISLKEGMVEHPAQLVGNYKIIPLEIKSVNSKTASVLDKWLSDNKLKAMSKEKQTRYLKKDAVFLVIQLDLKGMKSSEVKPLHIVLPAQKTYSLPIHFTHDDRSFELDVYSLNFTLKEENRGLKLFHNTKFIIEDPSFPLLKKISNINHGDLFKHQRAFSGADKSDDPLFVIGDLK